MPTSSAHHEDSNRAYEVRLCGLSTSPASGSPGGDGTREADEVTPPDPAELDDAGEAPLRASEVGDGHEPTPAASEPARVDRPRAKALASKGQAALAAGEIEQAESLFEQALGHDRRHVVALAGLRDVAFERSAYARAVKLGERVVRERPRAAEDRLRLGDSYLKVLRYHDALEQYELAHALGEGRADWRIDKVRKKLGLE